MLVRISIWFINIYHTLARSFALPSACRFSPTCSVYAVHALQKFGFTKGWYLAIKRLLKCHPFNAGGYDPVP